MRLDLGSERRGALGVRFGNVMCPMLLEFCVLIAPSWPFVLALFRDPAAEKPIQILRVSIIFAKNGGCIRVGNDVLLKILLVFDYLRDQRAKKNDIRTGADRHEHIRHGARTAKPGIDMNDSASASLCLHDPLEAHRMSFRHVGALDNNAIRVCKILQRGGGPASPIRGPQTGDRGRVSNTGLIFYLNDP
jgi:hypothetical protein